MYQRFGLRSALRKLLPERLREIEGLLPQMPPRFFTPTSALSPAVGEERARVGMLSGCVMSILFPEVNEATVRVLRRNGCAVLVPNSQICCGALNIHSGETATARVMARKNIDVFLNAGVSSVIVNAAGCGAAMKEYGHLLRDDPDYAEKARRFSLMVQDVSEFLVAIGPVAIPGTVEMKVTYQDPCHLAHGQRVRAQPRSLLAAIPGVRLIEMDAADRCCGSAGIYNLLQPEMSQELLREKMAAIAQTSAEAVVAPNPGCMLQLRYGAERYGPNVKILHLVDLLDQAYGPAEERP
jgi:glycolate oxidase iron-sulfur subunit